MRRALSLGLPPPQALAAWTRILGVASSAAPKPGCTCIEGAACKSPSQYYCSTWNLLYVGLTVYQLARLPVPPQRAGGSNCTAP